MVEKKMIVLNDGTEIINASISKVSNKQILVIIPGTNLVNATIMFSDTNKTSKMIAYHSIYKSIYNGFTVISSVGVREDDNETHIYMIGENTSMDYEYTVSERYLPESMRKKVDENE